MRRETTEQILKTPPPGLRMGSKTTQAYLNLREKILTGAYKPEQLIEPSDIQNEYHINNTSVQMILLRLAHDGLIKVEPVKKRNWPNNASLNEYRVAWLDLRYRAFSARHLDVVEAAALRGGFALKETLELTIQHADNEIAELLNIKPEKLVIFYRYLFRDFDNTVIGIDDIYLPLWDAEIIPELTRSTSDIYKVLIKFGKKPTWCTETVDVVQPNSKERVMFGLSQDDPTALLSILRCSFDVEGTPLDVEFLTERSDKYRLHYTFPLSIEEMPGARSRADYHQHQLQPAWGPQEDQED